MGGGGKRGGLEVGGDGDRGEVERRTGGGQLWAALPPLAECPAALAQVMKTMGLNNAVHWVAWFITGFVQLSISVTALTAILKYGQVLAHSHVLIIWLFLAVYAVATIMFW